MGCPRAQAPKAHRAEAFVEEALRWLPGEDPRPEIEIQTELADPVRAASPTGEPALVLVADDNGDMRDYLRRLLSERYQVEVVTDGEEALKAARRRRPDLILSDVMMPRLDGFGLLRAVRSDPELNDVRWCCSRHGPARRRASRGSRLAPTTISSSPSVRASCLPGSAPISTSRASAGERHGPSRRANSGFGSIFAEASVGIAQTDLSGRYVLVNRKYCDIVGRSMEELLGQPADRADASRRRLPL